jgi:hypothetical protein
MPQTAMPVTAVGNMRPPVAQMVVMAREEAVVYHIFRAQVL